MNAREAAADEEERGRRLQWWKENADTLVRMTKAEAEQLARLNMGMGPS